MKTASPELIAYLSTATEFLRADLYTVTLVGGYAVRYTDADIDLTVGGNVFRSFDVRRDRTRSSVGMEVDQMSVTICPSAADTLNGSPWIAAAQRGALDSAQVLIQRIYMPSWGDTSLGAIKLGGGRVADVQAGRSAVALTVNSEHELLDVKMPRNLYQSGCLNSLFDGACGLNKAAYAVACTVLAGSTTTELLATTGYAADYFSLGSLKFTAGVNANVSRSVRAFDGGRFTLALPLVTAPAPGDTFYAYPGCDKMQATCSGKFNNLVNFRGFPYIPDPETAV